MSSTLLFHDFYEINDDFVSTPQNTFIKILSYLTLLILFVVGLTAGIYLLITEDFYRNLNYSYTTSPNPQYSNENSDLQLPITNIFLSNNNEELNSNNCTAKEECAINLQNNNSLNNNTKSPYNFIINGDGIIYESLGWIHPCKSSHSCTNSSISIAFIDANGNSCPSKKAKKTVINFISDLVQKSKVKKCFLTSLDLKSLPNESKECLLDLSSDIQDVTKNNC